MTVTVDGEQLTPDPIGRAAFGSLLDKLLRTRDSILRVQVNEADGSSYADVLTPLAQLEPEPAPPSIGPSDPPQMPALVEITGDGFVPGEDVAFAPIFIHSSARSDGSVRSLVEFTDNVREVVVYGRVSGTIHVVKVPQ